ncbi:MAG TPA: hypothetical protein VFN09_10120 [Rhodanobacteraceae bacterium]|nr:hypothetical protein [Rhodanobacteraceae bacterium]
MASHARLSVFAPAMVLDFEARVLGDYAALLDATRALRDDIRRRGRVHA